ncbi:MAG: hypothetical protein U1F15_11535 [Burkholderiales bacterium]
MKARNFSRAILNEDRQGAVRSIQHLADAVPPDRRHTPQSLAAEYLNAFGREYGLPARFIRDAPIQLVPRLRREPASLRFAAEKATVSGRVVMYAQTAHGLPVWEHGLAVVLADTPLRATLSCGTVDPTIDVKFPAETAPFLPHLLDRRNLAVLGSASQDWVLNLMSPRVFQFRAAERIESLPAARRGGKKSARGHGERPTLPLPRLPDSIEDGRYYVATEVLFSLPLDGWGLLHWRAFVEVETGGVLYLRAAVEFKDVDALVYNYDPPTRGFNYMPNATVAQLDSVRQQWTLHDLASPPGSTQIGLTGSKYIELADLRPPAVPPPTVPDFPGQTFDYSALTPEFAAVNAYHHSTRFFVLLDSLGFDPATFFSGTTFPIKVDFSVTINGGLAMTRANASHTGTEMMFYGVLEPGLPTPSPISACSWRIVVHEFGHVLLNECLHAGSFGFAHGPGDALAAILCDPVSWASDRFRLDPWDRFSTGNRLDWFPAQGFGWGGRFDDSNNGGSLILCNTLFNAYRAIGGDFTYSGPNPFRRIRERERWADQMAYLIVRAIDSMPFASVTPVNRAEDFSAFLMNADRTTTAFRGMPGGVFWKVLRWAFERQGAFQAPNAPVPVTQPGVAPPVDVFIDTRRAGHYRWAGDWIWTTEEIWSRNAPDGGTVHEEPVGGSRAYAYVRVSNRGTTAASGVEVSLFTHDYDLSASWPAGFVAASPSKLAAAGPIPAPTTTLSSVVVGPFAYTAKAGYQFLFASASAPGDLSNVDAAGGLPCAAGSTPIEQLLRCDNNLALRVIYPSYPPPGGGPAAPGSDVRIPLPLLTNRFDRNVIVELVLHPPPRFGPLGWKLKGGWSEGVSVELPARGQIQPELLLRVGKFPPVRRGVKSEFVLAVSLRAFDGNDTMVGSGALRLDLAARFGGRQRPRERPDGRPDAAKRKPRRRA